MPELELPAEEPIEESAFPQAEEDTWLADEEIDPATIVTIRPGAGQPRYLVVDGPTPFGDLVQRAGIMWNGQVDLFVEGQPIQMSDLVQGGQTVTMLGNVKGIR